MTIQALSLTDGEIDLAAALAAGEVVPFFGSGFTVEAFKQASLSTALPTWNGFVDSLVAECGHPPLGNAMEVFWDALPDLLQIVLDNTGTRAPISEILERTFTEHAVPYEAVAKQRLAKMFIALKPPIVLTTNYDKLLEAMWPESEALELSSDSHWKRIEALMTSKIPRTRCPKAIIKIHGSAGNALEAAVTSTDYRRLFAESRRVQQLMLSIGKWYSIWFIGYAIRDTDIRWAMTELQESCMHRQHFRHELRLSHPLQPRVEHVQRNVRLFELDPETLTQRVQRIRTMTRTFRNNPLAFSLFESSDAMVAKFLRILSRYEVTWSETLGQSLIDKWLGEIEEQTGGWTATLHGYERWERFFSAERILRHHLFLRGRSADRELLANYVLSVLEKVPPRFAIEAIGVIAEGLCYMRKELNVLASANDRLQRIERRSKAGNEKAFALVQALIHRSFAKWIQDPDDRREPLRGAVKAAALAGASEFQSACLLDLAWIPVDKLIESPLRLPEDERVDGLLTARAALELALYGGSYRRADFALQRLAILDRPEQATQWLRSAWQLRREHRLPAEVRNRFYFDLARALVYKRGEDESKAVAILTRTERKLIEVGKFGEADRKFFARVKSAIQPA
ncbi:MAG TPA: SIR2 family protein [Longimicrobium sp.]|nr:SIR2 family protein [Longimicrobium sp.]